MRVEFGVCGALRGAVFCGCFGAGLAASLVASLAAGLQSGLQLMVTEDTNGDSAISSDL